MEISATLWAHIAWERTLLFNNNNNNIICVAQLGRNFRDANTV